MTVQPDSHDGYGAIRHAARHVIKTEHYELDCIVEMDYCAAAHFSTASVCPICGVLWYRLYGYREWRAETALCPEHGGGSIMGNFPHSDLPPELLRYELLITDPKGLI